VSASFFSHTPRITQCTRELHIYSLFFCPKDLGLFFLICKTVRLLYIRMFVRMNKVKKICILDPSLVHGPRRTCTMSLWNAQKSWPPYSGSTKALLRNGRAQVKIQNSLLGQGSIKQQSLTYGPVAQKVCKISTCVLGGSSSSSCIVSPASCCQNPSVS